MRKIRWYPESDSTGPDMLPTGVALVPSSNWLCISPGPNEPKSPPCEGMPGRAGVIDPLSARLVQHLWFSHVRALTQGTHTFAKEPQSERSRAYLAKTSSVAPSALICGMVNVRMRGHLGSVRQRARARRYPHLGSVLLELLQCGVGGDPGGGLSCPTRDGIATT
eukprot:scaffold189899_cov33-Tisochrysis_lutea.AAC.1